MAVLAGHDHGAARAADGVGAETLFKKHALLRQFVDVRRGIYRFQPAIVRANGVRRVIITKYEENVRALVLSLSQRSHGQDQYKSECKTVFHGLANGVFRDYRTPVESRGYCGLTRPCGQVVFQEIRYRRAQMQRGALAFAD